jgi:ABC-2 type transport system permease protein
MNRILALSKVILKNSNNLFVTSNKSKRQVKPINRVLTIVALIFLYLYVAFINGFSFFQISSYLEATQESYLLSPLLGLMLVAVGLFFGLFTVISMFFTASDNHLWVPLPLKIEEIFTARFISTYLFLLLIQMMFIFPAFVGYNIVSQPGILSYLGQIIIFLAIPILVIALAFIVIALISRIVNIQKNRKLFQIISGILILVFSFGISFAGSSFGGTMGDEIDLLVTAVKSLSESLKWASFMTMFTDGAFINQGYLSIVFPLVVLAVAALFFFLAYWLASKIYHASLFSIDVTKRKRKETIDKTVVKTTSPALAFFKNEVRTIFRSSTYTLNLAAPILMVLIITIFSTIGGLSSIPEEQGNLVDLIGFIFDPQYGHLLTIGVGASAFFFMMNMISATAFTREGNNAQLLKIYPVNVRDILYGKMLLGFLINEIVMTLFIITLGIIAKANFFIILAYVIAITLVNVVMNYISVLLDARFPLLNWTNEIEAAKQNKNVLISMGINFLITTIIIGLSVPIYFMGLPFGLAFVFLISILILVIVVLELLVHKSGPKLLKKIQ